MLALMLALAARIGVLALSVGAAAPLALSADAKVHARVICSAAPSSQARASCLATAARPIRTPQLTVAAAAQLRDRTVSEQRRAVQKLRQQTVPRRAALAR